MLLEVTDWKIMATIAAVVIANASFIPYLWQIFKRKTEPHAYTWLVWSITQMTVAAGVWYGGGGIVSAGMLLAAIISLGIFFLSFKYGTKNITTSDTFVLAGALAAVVIWWQLDNPVLAVVVATGIDIIGYYPTYRKSFHEPRTENLLFWIGATLTPALVLLSLLEYNLMTTTWAVATLIANMILVLLLVIRRRLVSK